jgi:hypothetical protein
VSLDVSTEKNHLYTSITVGEVYYGNESTGGNVGTGSTDTFQLSTLYAEREITEKVKLQAGLASVSSDPRGFIFSDDIGSLSVIGDIEKFTYQMWYAEGTKQRPSDSDEQAEDRYIGLNTTFKLAKSSWSPFIVHRHLYGEAFQDESQTEAYGVSSDYYWAGINSVFSFTENSSLDVTAIYNYGSSNFENFSDDDSYSAYLVDLKWQNQISKFSYALEFFGYIGC